MNVKKGLVLGSGGAWGFAHLGVLQVLDEQEEATRLGRCIALAKYSEIKRLTT